MEDYGLIGDMQAAALVGRDGPVMPWIEPGPDGVLATAGPDAFRLSTALPLHVQTARSAPTLLPSRELASASC